MERGLRTWVSCGLAGVALLGACGGGERSDVSGSTSSPSPQDDATIPLVVDTDLAADDIVALAYLASDTRVDLLAVTVSGTGEVTCPRGAEIAASLLAELERPDVPVACGAPDPLEGDRRFPTTWRAAADGAWELQLAELAPTESAQNGVEVPDGSSEAATLLAQQISASRRPVTVLTLGPLTNVAQMLLDHDGPPSTIARVVMMGGAVEVAGNVELDENSPLGAEWNLYIDPRAADMVVTSGLPITLVTLDATNGVPVTETSLELLVTNDVSAATAMVRQLFERYPPPFLWDPLAAIAVTDPDVVAARDVTIEVVTDGSDAGRTIEQTTGTEVEMLTPPDDPEAVVAHLVRTLAGVEDDELATPTTPRRPVTSR